MPIASKNINAEKMKQVFDNNLQITESIRRLIATIKPMLS